MIRLWAPVMRCDGRDAGRCAGLQLAGLGMPGPIGYAAIWVPYVWWGLFSPLCGFLPTIMREGSGDHWLGPILAVRSNTVFTRALATGSRKG